MTKEEIIAAWEWVAKDLREHDPDSDVAIIMAVTLEACAEFLHEHL